jgi:hypothetical protein
MKWLKWCLKYGLKYSLISIVILVVASESIVGISIKVEDYLKSKIIGMPIIYEDNGTYKKAIGMDVIRIKNRYTVVVNNSDHVLIVFNTNAFSGRSLNRSVRNAINSRDNQNRERELQQQVINTQQLINDALSSIGSAAAMMTTPAPIIPTIGDRLSGDRSTISDNQATTNINKLQNTEEILYTDLRSNKKKQGKASATLAGIVLDTGEPIQVRLVRN